MDIANGLHDVPPGKVAMVVTHLQMTAPAPLRPAPEADGITLRQVAADVAWYRDIFDRVGRDWLWFGRRRMPDAELAALLRDEGIELHTLRRDGVDEALLELDFRKEGECELAYFGLTPALVGSGAGRLLMNEAITRAWARPIRRFHVHTCTLDSPQALDFYIRSGFVPYRRQVEIEDDPRLSGLLPQGSAPHVPVLGP